VPAAGGNLIGFPATLNARYSDRSGLRTAEAIVGVAGVLSGIIMIAESYQDIQDCDAYGYCCQHSKVDNPLLFGGEQGAFFGLLDMMPRGDQCFSTVSGN
jgi:hypothetical protein